MEIAGRKEDTQELTPEQRGLLSKAVSFTDAAQSAYNSEFKRIAEGIRQGYERSYNFNTPEQRAEGIFDETEYEIDEEEADRHINEDPQLRRISDDAQDA